MQTEQTKPMSQLRERSNVTQQKDSHRSLSSWKEAAKTRASWTLGWVTTQLQICPRSAACCRRPHTSFTNCCLPVPPWQPQPAGRDPVCSQESPLPPSLQSWGVTELRGKTAEKICTLLCKTSHLQFGKLFPRQCSVWR